MNLLKTLLIYLTMVFVSSVQTAPEPSLVPQTPTPSPTLAIVAATDAPTATPVPTPDITPNDQYHTLQVGDRSDTIKLMQQRLAELGYYTGEIDGAFGNQTRRAVEQFQYNNGLSVDGIAGKRTLTVLYESEDVVSATVEETATPEAADTTPPPTSTPEPTFVPTPSPTPAPTAEPETTSETGPAADASPAVTETAPEATETLPAQTETGADASSATAVPEATYIPAETETPEPTETPAAPVVMEQQTFILAGETEALTLQSEEGLAMEEPPALHPLQYGDTVYVPFLEIIRNAGSVILPGGGDVVWEVAFTLNEDLYQLSYTLDEDNAITGLTVQKNQEPQIVPDRTGYMVDNVLYLPLQTTVAAMGVAYELNGAADVYTVTLSPANEEKT